MHLLYQAASAAASPKYNKITTFSSAPRFSLRLSSTGNHPRNNANAIRKYHRALSRGFPQFSRKYFIIQRQHKGQRDGIGSHPPGAFSLGRIISTSPALRR